MHGLKCVDREGTACTKVVLQSRVRIWRWYVVGYAVILPARWWCCAWTFLLISGFCSSACCLFPCLVLSSLRGRWFLAFSVRRVPSPPWEGAVLVLSVLRLFVVLVYFAVEEFFLLCLVLLSLLCSCLLYDLDFDDFIMDSVFWPFSRHFPSCEVPARWRDLPNVVLGIWGK